jgi:hypothetical protein
MSASRSATPLMVALVVHLGIALSLRAVPTRAVSMGNSASPRDEVADITFDITTATSAPEPEPAIASRDVTVAPRRVEAAARTGGVESAGAPSGAAIDNGNPGLDRGADDPAGAAWFRPNAVVDLRLSANGRAPTATPERPAQAPPASTTGGLAEGLDAADFARGMGRGGPVRTAVEDAARSGDAPIFGTATFSVVIAADGKVSVDVASASGDRTAWEGLRPAIRTALVGKPVRIAPKTRGLRVTVHVEASEQFPGGGRPPPPSKQGAALSGSIGKVTETKDHVDIELPSVALTYQSRKCAAGIVVSPGGVSAGGGCNPGVAMRVVAARIVGEERL